MIILESADKRLAPSDLEQMALPLAKHLLPSGEVISRLPTTNAFQMILKTDSELVGLEMLERDATSDHFESLLRLSVDLEAKRKLELNCHIEDIRFCLLAPDFSNSFVRRIPSSLVTLQLYRWELVASHESLGVLLRKFNATPRQSKEPLPSDTGQPSMLSGDEKAAPLSTPELVAFSQFDRELRQRRTQAGK